MDDTPAAARHTLRFDDGADVVVSWFRPSGPPHGTIVVLPALGVQAGYYEPLAVAFTAVGFGVATADLRGLGESSVRPRRGVDFGYARLVADAAAVVHDLRARAGGPVYVLGHSLGGHLGGLLAGAHPELIDGLMLVASGSPYWKPYAGSTGFKVLVFAHLARALSLVLGYYPGHRVGFSGIEAARLMREWSGLARTGLLRVDGLDAEATWAAARLPVLTVSIEGDWLAPPSAAEALAGKLRSARVQRVHVAEATDIRAHDHFKWARYPDAVVQVIAGWIASEFKTATALRDRTSGPSGSGARPDPRSDRP